jgi:CBS domain-containing protein
MKVADAMTPRSEVVVAELPGTRDDVLELLQERSFSSVPVVKQVDGEERFRGLVSRDDLIERADEDQLALLMREVPTTTEDADLTEVAALRWHRWVLAAAGLDVYPEEPEGPASLRQLPNAFVLPHLGSATREARSGMWRIARDNVRRVLSGGDPLTPVTGSDPVGTDAGHASG